MSIIVNTISFFLFEANLDASKTEVIVRIVGVGKDAVKRNIKNAGNTISFPTVYGVRKVNVVDKYAHLGMSATADCSHKSEITIRRRICNQALGPIAAKCFSIAEIPVQKKVNITMAYVFSKLLCGAGSWCTLTKQEETSVSSVIMHSWRRATNSTFKERADNDMMPVDDEQVVQQFELMSCDHDSAYENQPLHSGRLQQQCHYKGCDIRRT